MEEYAKMEVSEKLAPVKEMLTGLVAKYQAAIAKVNEVNDPAFTDFMARRLVEMAGNIIMSYLLITDASRYNSESMTKSAIVYGNIARAEVEKHAEFIANFCPCQLEVYKA